MTKKITFLILSFVLFANSIFSQTVNNNPLFTPNNRLNFGNYLFSQKDYLRAVDEYQAYIEAVPNDTINFKIAFANSEMGKSLLSMSEFKKLFHSKSLGEYSKLYYARENLKNNNSSYFSNKVIQTSKSFVNDSLIIVNKNFQMMRNFSDLINNEIPKNLDTFLSPFPINLENDLAQFYKRKTEPNYKSDITAGVLSAIIPGSGKVYVGKIGDGLTAFIVTGLLTFLAVDNFKADHRTRAWIFTGLASAFYAGNIYGSVIASQQYNLGIQISFSQDVKVFLKKHNYFVPLPKFLFKK